MYGFISGHLILFHLSLFLFWSLFFKEIKDFHTLARIYYIKLMCCAVLSCSAMSDSLQPHELQLARLLCPWGFYRQENWSGLTCLSPGDLDWTQISPTLQVDSLLTEPSGKSKNTGLGSLSLFQGIYPTQELNWGLLHCRQILYQLSYQRNPH